MLSPPSPKPTRPRKPRLPGRPAAGRHDHREALIDAARDSFAAHGYAASSLRQIAIAAKVTPALSHYSFKDKAGLLEAVVEQRVAPLVQAMGGAVVAAPFAPGIAGIAAGTRLRLYPADSSAFGCDRRDSAGIARDDRVLESPLLPERNRTRCSVEESAR